MLLLVGVTAGACKSVPVQPLVVTPPAPVVTTDMKIGWILRLEQERTLADLASPAAVPVAGAVGSSAVAASTPSPNLVALSKDADATVRWRAILALGRVGQSDALPALVAGLSDEQADVRSAAAFGLGLLGSTDAVPALTASLTDASVVVRGRVIEALGLIGQAGAAGAIVSAATGCDGLLASVAPDDEAWPKSPEIELCRLSLFSLVRLRDFDALSRVALDRQGQPVSSWWPVAYALQRIGDPRATPALRALLMVPATYTPAFAARGLAAAKDTQALPQIRALALRRDIDIKLRVPAIRAFAQLGGADACAPLLGLLDEPNLPTNVLLEVIAAIGVTANKSAFDPLLDLIADRVPAVRAAALSSAAKSDPAAFLVVLSGLGRDSDWSVRAALAGVLGTLPGERVTAALEDLASDEDARVHGPALEAMAAAKVPSFPSKVFAALDAADYVERATAAELIGANKLDGGAPRLIAAYARGASDTAYGARAAAIGALAAYGADVAGPTLRTALRDADWVVRARAAALLRGLGQGASPERPAPIRTPVAAFSSADLLHPRFSPHAFIDTARGSIELQLDVVSAPLVVRQFIDQARTGFFNGLKLHRVVPAFVAQGGDPRGDGSGGPGFTMRDEFSWTPFMRGTVGLATEGISPDWRDTAGSQFFVTLGPQPHLDGRYTAFARVVSGWDALDLLTPGDVIERIRIWDGVELK